MPLFKAIRTVLMAFLCPIAIMVTTIVIIDPRPPFYQPLASYLQFFVFVH